MAILSSSESADFRFLRDTLELKDADLSKQMSALESSGYVSVNKTRPGAGSVTRYRITKPGRTAFESHTAALRELIDNPPSPT